ncbi:hypothetical protein G3I59_24055 [Amycolatopsis rubida]|uniref:Uncharacterized protein n=1 Tax=Amycolatopsis rubida TaxID=112413 RepID=A0ABX0BWQ2_9PSEU|nr:MULTISPECIES: hypothetical protein [Amycolatopsis]MYW93602.1 hypothetical protein [Amycolatopsis rubida]NEC58589.1 hypothetical protein [Amycolatopsis rubida]OAP22678.1 hypothetical protein A4R44_06551 [Amycolatopsis sp. M39]
MIVVVLIAAAVDSDVDHAVTGGFNVVVWIALIGGGLWLASKAYEKNKTTVAANAKSAKDKTLSERYSRATEWQRATREAKLPDARHPGPVQLSLGGSVREAVTGADRARRTVREVIAALPVRVSEEARAHAKVLRPPVERLCEAGRYFQEEEDEGRYNVWWGPERTGTRPTREVVGQVKDMFGWAAARRNLVSDIHPEAERLLATLTGALAQRFRDSLQTRYGRADDGSGIAVLPPGEWEALLGDLHAALVAVADGLAALPRPKLLPLMHRPHEARFKEHVSGEAMEQDLRGFIEDTAKLREAALTGPWPDQFGSGRKLDGGVLDGFLTEEIRRRLAKGTEGFEAVAQWSTDRIDAESLARGYLAYLTIALDYLTEVLGNMADYKRDSAPRSGHRIEIGGDVTHSNFILDSRVRDITTVLAPVAGRDDRLAEAIEALSAAVREDPGLPDDEREELLYHVKDIAEAAAEPGEKQKRGRAKLALSAVTEAAKTGAQLAQAVTAWHDVLSKMF